MSPNLQELRNGFACAFMQLRALRSSHPEFGWLLEQRQIALTGNNGSSHPEFGWLLEQERPTQSSSQ